MIRAAIVALFLTLYTILAGPLLIVHALLTGSVDLLYRTSLRAVMFAVRSVGVRVRVEGRENIPPGVCVFVANHTSNADPPVVVSAIPRQVSILAKKSLFSIPIVSRAFRLAHFVPVDRSNPEAAIASMETAISYLKRGVSFLVYPEGTRSPDGRLLPFKKGPVVMAIKAGVPIVPVAVAGAHRIMRKGQLSVHPGEIVVKFQQTIDASQYSIDEREQLLARVHTAVAAGLPPDQQPRHA